MPSVINPRSGPFPIYSSTSPPVVDVGMFTIAKTGVDLKTAATTTIFTVPANRAFLLTGITIYVTGVTSGGAGTLSFQMKESSGTRPMTPTYGYSSSTPVANQSCLSYAADINNSAIRSTCASGNGVTFVNNGSNAGSTTVTGTVYVTGVYVA